MSRRPGNLSISRVWLWLGLLLLAVGCVPSGVETAVSAPDFAAYPWVYLRDGRPLAPDEETITLLAVGDVLLGRGVAAQPDPLARAAPLLQAADLTLGNLEGVISDGHAAPATPDVRALLDHPQGERIVLTMPPSSAAELQDAGFDLLGLANNHSLDLGTRGLAETADRLEAAGLVPLGLQRGAAPTPVLQTVNGVRLAFLALNAVPDPQGAERCDPNAQPCPAAWREETAVAAIRRARGDADAVIVSIHWGFEYESRPDPAQEKIAAALREAGADLVLGHHPHVAQPLAAGEDGLTAYSLGNFLFDQDTAETQNGLALLAYVDAHGLRAAQALPLRAGLQPRLLTVEEAQPWLAALLPAPPRRAFACDPTGCTAAAAPPAGDGSFFSGQIDLTGDGAAETVRREGQRIIIYEGTVPVWRSPDEWRVVDAALGDPNDDGRFEIMLAVRRADEAGHERSQPYIVGYRGGAYGLLWGGRPVVDPIRELALGDVDGDGIEELVVIIEQADGAAQSLAVWQWQGWSFSLQWQSEPGHFQDLLLQEEGGRTVITATEYAQTP